MLMLPQEPTFEDIARTGATTVTREDPHLICDGFFFGSGAIERVTDYETASSATTASAARSANSIR
jgi:7,8-dihydropterin-6-yl-methyl-4-(beta-D-ribofuranosyl)aminobenzene 5'-phosphate synthase